MKARRRNGAPNETGLADLFPATWSAGAWPWFCADLLAVLYKTSGELWTEVRPACDRLTGWYEHQLYEDEITSQNSFGDVWRQATMTVDEVAALRSARGRLGAPAWNALLSRAERQAASDTHRSTKARPSSKPSSKAATQRRRTTR